MSCMIKWNSLCVCCRENLQSVFDLVSVVNVLDSQDSVNLELLSRPELGVTFTKLHCWRLTQYSKCVFLDADTLVCHCGMTFCSITIKINIKCKQINFMIKYINDFYVRSYRLDVCLSVRLSRAGIVSKRLNILSCFLLHTIAHSF